ncbi:MAG: leucine-rich repeat domain-containing protein [Bacteroides sp.]|nr:leucine-rich repeat domain-containing protein [Bacteroides sp.]
MKKILAAALSIIMLSLLPSCNNEEKTNASEYTGSIKKEAKTLAISTNSESEPVTTEPATTELPPKTDTQETDIETNTSDNTNAEDFIYTENENGDIIIVQYKGNLKTVVFPSKINEKRVVQIGEDSGDIPVVDGSVRSITVPLGTVKIAGWAFCGCEELCEVNIEEGLEAIGSGAFRLCKSLKRITIPNSVQTIGGEAFSESGITEITIPSGVKRIYAGAFSGCGDLTGAVLSEGLEIMGSAAFRDCGKLTELIIPDSVKEIGRDAFSGCGIKGLTLPDGLDKFDGSTELYDCDITFRGITYAPDSYNDLYTAVNGRPYEIPCGIPPAA